jgi:predicted ArsR family transcriptional regulator
MFVVVNNNASIKQDLADDCTTRGILTILKEKGPTDANTLAELLCISAPGIRQHLYDLQEKKLVNFAEEARPMGRPAKIWQLTEKANSCFPDNHAAISLSLLQSAKAAFGTEGLCKLLAQYAKDQVRTYRERTKCCKSLTDRLNTLAACRCEEGYMAELGADQDGNILFIENHCPISCAAQTCSEICDGELNMFRDILGTGTCVERIEHMVNGNRRCVYRITEAAVAA